MYTPRIYRFSFTYNEKITGAVSTRLDEETVDCNLNAVSLRCCQDVEAELVAVVVADFVVG